MSDVLKCISVAMKHTDLVRFPQQWPDAISDGQWMIKRTALTSLLNNRHVKLPTYIKDAMLAPVGENLKPVFDELCTYRQETAIAIELSPLLSPLEAKKGTLMCRFDGVDKPELRIYANAHLVKLLADIFPVANWFATEPLKPIMLVHDHELLAFMMPIASKKQIPGFSSHEQKIGLTNTEILMYALGWQGGTIHQVSQAIGVDDQAILDATPDELRGYVRYAHGYRNTKTESSVAC